MRSRQEKKTVGPDANAKMFAAGAEVPTAISQLLAAGCHREVYRTFPTGGGV